MDYEVIPPLEVLLYIFSLPVVCGIFVLFFTSTYCIVTVNVSASQNKVPDKVLWPCFLFIFVDMKQHCKRSITIEFYQSVLEELVVPLNLVKFIFCHRIETTLNYPGIPWLEPEKSFSTKAGNGDGIACLKYHNESKTL